MAAYSHDESLHRLIKQVMDSGEASSRAEAEALFRTYTIGYRLGAGESNDPGHQAALLTGVTLGRRVFLGGTMVEGELDVPLLVHRHLGVTLRDAVTSLGGKIGSPNASAPTVALGGRDSCQGDGFHVRAVFGGWRGGVVPEGQTPPNISGPYIPIAAMLAVALAVNEAFLFVRGEGSAAGRRSVGMSLWDPAPGVDWLTAGEGEPRLENLPDRLWILGLGHLGQAYLWGLGLLPYPDPSRLHLVLQDVDSITPSTESTSVLTDSRLIGQRKTRAMAEWADDRGFSTSIVERLFDAGLMLQDGEPVVALCGIDNALGRRALDKVGFKLVIEAGLGRGYRDFRTMRLHTLPSHRPAEEIWKPQEIAENVLDRSAYKEMLKNGDLDTCGVTLLAGKAVGAPFVGAVAACLGLAELLRQLHGGPVHQLLDLDLVGIEHRTVVRHTMDFHTLNPGFVHLDNR